MTYASVVGKRSINTKAPSTSHSGKTRSSSPPFRRAMRIKRKAGAIEIVVPAYKRSRAKLVPEGHQTGNRRVVFHFPDLNDQGDHGVNQQQRREQILCQPHPPLSAVGWKWFWEIQSEKHHAQRPRGIAACPVKFSHVADPRSPRFRSCRKKVGQS